MPGCCILSCLAAPVRWIMSSIHHKGSYVARNQSGDLSHNRTQEALQLCNERDYWWVESKLWPQFSARFGFDRCEQVHMNFYEPYYTTICDKGSRQWPDAIPCSVKSLYKVRLLYLSVTNPHGIVENKYDNEGNLIKRPLLHVTNSPTRSAKKYHFCVESRLKQQEKRIAVPWEPKSAPDVSLHVRWSVQERYLVVAYSQTIAVILEVSHNGGQVLHILNLLAELYHGNISIRGYMHSFISPDEKLLVIGDCLANGELEWTVVKISGKTLAIVGKLSGHDNIHHWCVYSTLSFEPKTFQNRFVIGGTCCKVNAVNISNALSAFIVDGHRDLQPCDTIFIHFKISHITHSPDGALCIVLNDDQRQIHIYNTETLHEIKVIKERSIPCPLPRKEVFLFPKLHFGVNRDPGQLLMFKMYRWISGCNVVRVSRGGLFLNLSTCDRTDPNKIIRRIILRLPILQVLSLKEFCKRQILQMVPQEHGNQLPLPKEIKAYLLLR